MNRKNFENFLELNRRRLKDIIAIYKFGEYHSLITSDNQAERYIIGQKQNLEKALEDFENKEALLKKLNVPFARM